MPLMYIPTFESILLLALFLWFSLAIFQYRSKSRAVNLWIYAPWCLLYGLILILAFLFDWISNCLMDTANLVEKVIPSK